MQIETLVRHIVFDDVWLVWLCCNFRNYIVRDTNFEEKMFETKCLDLSEKFFILQIIERDIIMNLHLSVCKVPHTFLRC
jgi:hypothetical protein